MGPDLEKAIHEISMRMRLLKAMQEDASSSENLTERDVMILSLLNEQGAMTISRMNPNARDIPVPKLKPNSLRYIRLMGHSHQGEKDGI